MAVYTPVDDQALREFLADYTVGELVDSSAIQTGIENTNYFVTTTQGKFVLTLFETVSESDLPYFLDLMGWLAERGVPSAHPIANRRGEYLFRMCERPAALVGRLPGQSVLDPTPMQCAAAGRLLGRLHRAGRGFSQARPNPRGADWRRACAEALMPRLSGEEAGLLRREIGVQEQRPAAELPQGVIHADLFRDNVLFENDTVSGVVDFYYACTDSLIFDLAVTANDWCTDADGRWRSPLIVALLDGYQQERTLTETEIEAWARVVRAAALRFWLSRLKDKYYPRVDSDNYTKDPAEYRRILERRIEDGEDSAGYLV